MSFLYTIARSVTTLKNIIYDVVTTPNTMKTELIPKVYDYNLKNEGQTSILGCNTISIKNKEWMMPDLDSDSDYEIVASPPVELQIMNIS